MIKNENSKKESLPLPVAIKWTAMEYEFTPKSNNWFWSIGIMTFGIVLAAILLGNILFAIVVLIAGFTIILYGAKKPLMVEFFVSYKGIQIDKRLFPFDNLNSFWIHYEPLHKKFAAVEPKKFFMPTISIPLGDTDPNILRAYFLKFLKEEYREESLITTIIRLLGF